METNCKEGPKVVFGIIKNSCCFDFVVAFSVEMLQFLLSFLPKMNSSIKQSDSENVFHVGTLSATLQLLPKKSMDKYEKDYKIFKTCCRKRKLNVFQRAYYLRIPPNVIKKGQNKKCE